MRHTSVPLPGIVHSMSMSSLAAVLPIDRRQSPIALAVARGTTRLLHSLGFAVVSELPLASGRRAEGQDESNRTTGVVLLGARDRRTYPGHCRRTRERRNLPSRDPGLDHIRLPSRSRSADTARS